MLLSTQLVITGKVSPSHLEKNDGSHINSTTASAIPSSELNTMSTVISSSSPFFLGFSGSLSVEVGTDACAGGAVCSPACAGDSAGGSDNSAGLPGICSAGSPEGDGSAVSAFFAGFSSSSSRPASSADRIRHL